MMIHQNVTVVNHGLFLWQQTNSMPILGLWYLDNVRVNNFYTDNFESGNLKLVGNNDVSL